MRRSRRLELGDSAPATGQAPDRSPGRRRSAPGAAGQDPATCLQGLAAALLSGSKLPSRGVISCSSCGARRRDGRRTDGALLRPLPPTGPAGRITPSCKPHASGETVLLNFKAACPLAWIVEMAAVEDPRAALLKLAALLQCSRSARGGLKKQRRLLPALVGRARTGRGRRQVLTAKAISQRALLAGRGEVWRFWPNT